MESWSMGTRFLQFRCSWQFRKWLRSSRCARRSASTTQSATRRHTTAAQIILCRSVLFSQSLYEPAKFALSQVYRNNFLQKLHISLIELEFNLVYFRRAHYTELSGYCTRSFPQRLTRGWPNSWPALRKSLCTTEFANLKSSTNRICNSDRELCYSHIMI